jgi:hypothetical protein
LDSHELFAVFLPQVWFAALLSQGSWNLSKHGISFKVPVRHDGNGQLCARSQQGSSPGADHFFGSNFLNVTQQHS